MPKDAKDETHFMTWTWNIEKDEAINVPEEITDWRLLDLQSGDVILCSGNGGMSKRIQWFQRIASEAKPDEYQMSHVAGIAGEACRYVLESTTFNKWANKKGVQRNCFEEWLDNYNGKVWVKKMLFERTDGYYSSDRIFWNKVDGQPYENGIPGYWELILCGLGLDKVVRWFKPDYYPKQTTEIHCTELIVRRLQYHDLLAKCVIPARMPPWKWVRFINDYLTGAVAGEIYRIK